MNETTNLLSYDAMVAEFARLLKDQLTNGQHSFPSPENMHCDDTFGEEGAKLGDVLRVKKEITPTMSLPNNVVELFQAVEATTHRNIAIPFTLNDRRLSLEQFSADILLPNAAQLASDILADGTQRTIYKKFGFWKRLITRKEGARVSIPFAGKTLVFAPLADVGKFGARWVNAKDASLSVRFVEQYQASTDTILRRVDVLYGWAE